MGQVTNRLALALASSEATEAVFCWALGVAIREVIEAPAAAAAPDYVRAALEAVRAAYEAVALVMYEAELPVAQQGSSLTDRLDEAMEGAALAEFAFGTALMRWRAEWLSQGPTGRDAGPRPPMAEFLGTFSDAFVNLIASDASQCIPRYVREAISERQRGYYLSSCTLYWACARCQDPDPLLAVSLPKVLAELSFADFEAAHALMLWRLQWRTKWEYALHRSPPVPPKPAGVERTHP